MNKRKNSIGLRVAASLAAAGAALAIGAGVASADIYPGDPGSENLRPAPCWQSWSVTPDWCHSPWSAFYKPIGPAY